VSSLKEDRSNDQGKAQARGVTGSASRFALPGGDPPRL